LVLIGQNFSKGVKTINVHVFVSNGFISGHKGCHKIQGISLGFILDNIDMFVLDDIVTVSLEEELFYARKIAREEGLLVGISSGAAFSTDLKVSNTYNLAIIHVQ